MLEPFGWLDEIRPLKVTGCLRRTVVLFEVMVTFVAMFNAKHAVHVASAITFASVRLAL